MLLENIRLQLLIALSAGYLNLSASDTIKSEWVNPQPTGNYITSLTGDPNNHEADILQNQKYFPFPVENADWNVYLISGCNNEAPPDTILLRYTLSGDTVIHDIDYKKLCLESGDTASPHIKTVGGIREDNRKIYFTGEDFLGNLHDEEILLYNFTGTIGDTITHISGGEIFTVIEDIDSVLIGDEYRKRYTVNNTGPINNPDYIIEGIGSVMNGLLGHITDIPTCGEHYWEHICFKENNTVKYLNPDFGECYPTRLLSPVKQFSYDGYISIYPNPVERELIIENHTNETGLSFEIINILGDIVLQNMLVDNKSQVQFNFNPSMYQVIVSDKNGRIIKTEKIVKL